ncbi:MAG: ABC transporter permease [Thiovulaceae bacterium]|nr:ABC transporter permease [Sulfurimonadaceae bacterium]
MIASSKPPLFSFYLFGIMLIVLFLGPYVYTVSPYALGVDAILQAPSFSHILGTDRLGRDLLSRILQGGQVSIIIGVGSALVATGLGLIAGVIAGYVQGKTDKAFVISVDLFLTFPTFFLLLALASYMEASVLILVFIISITGWMTTARLIRAESFAITAKPFIKILRVARVHPLKILFKYYLPMLLPIFLVSFTFGVGGAILAESGLSYLGLGVTPPQMSWGSILSEGKEVLDVAWWISFFPGLCIFLVTFAMINISDYLQKLSNQQPKH